MFDNYFKEKELTLLRCLLIDSSIGLNELDSIELGQRIEHCKSLSWKDYKMWLKNR